MTIEESIKEFLLYYSDISYKLMKYLELFIELELELEKLGLIEKKNGENRCNPL